MSETIQQSSWMRRLNHTPWRDLIRGRVTGRLDFKGRIDAAGLPAPAKDLIQRILRQTRLWRIEKVDVANELIAHFADGIAAGATIDQLLKSFGDERAAAKLIRRAKKRGRPLAWHIFRAVSWTILCLLVIYFVLAVSFVVGKPSLKINYVDFINRDAAKIAPDQRAWPLYRQALLAINAYEKGLPDNAAREEWSKTLSATPAGKRWPAMLAWQDAHRDTIEQIRKGAQKPAMGLVHGPNGSSNDPELFDAGITTQKFPEESILSLLLPALNPLRHLSILLAADASAARQKNDARRLIDDLHAMISFSKQLRENDDILLTDLVSLNIANQAIEQIDLTLLETPQLLDDAELSRLAHRLTGPQVAADLMSLQTERAFFYDSVQHMYTDNGSGDGHLTLKGVQFLPRIMTPTPGNKDEYYVLLALSAPFMSGSRKQVTQRYEQIVALAEANLHQPLRSADWAGYQKLTAESQSYSSALRFSPLAAIFPSLTRIHVTAERYLGHRDGATTALALEAYRRQHGAYPESLDALVPALLPRVPEDRINGGPVRYRLVDGRPLVYSLGRDNDDDQGRVPLNKNDKPERFAAAEWPGLYPKAADGDWVLFPQIPDAPQDDEP